MATGDKYSVLEMPLITQPWQEDALCKKMECVRRVYNTMLSFELKKYNQMIRTKEWRTINETIREELQLCESSKCRKSERLKAAYDRKNAILKENGFTKFDFISLAIQSSKYYQKNISSKMANMGIAVPMWTAFEKLFFGNGEKVSFKKFDGVDTLVSDNKSGIRLIKEDDRYFVVCSNNFARAKEVKMPINGPNTIYDREMLGASVKVIRIVKKVEKGKKKFYCQLTVARTPYIKTDAQGSPRHPIGEGTVGIAIWRDTLCAVSASKVLKINLSPNAEEFFLLREELSRKLEHLQRVNNPDNYNEDGTVKKGIIGEDGKRHQLCWKESNHYKTVKAQLRELYRKHNVEKGLIRNKAILQLLSMGNTFRFADTSFLTFKPEWDEESPLHNYEYRKKKDRRLAIQEYAPATFLTKMDMKLAGRGLPPILRFTIPENLYWYRHDTGVSDKSFFSNKDILMCGKVVEQTLYRAFLIRHFGTTTLNSYDQKALTKEWESFIMNIEE